VGPEGFDPDQGIMSPRPAFFNPVFSFAYNNSCSARSRVGAVLFLPVTSCWAGFGQSKSGPDTRNSLSCGGPLVLFVVNSSIATALREREVDHTSCSPPLTPA